MITQGLEFRVPENWNLFMAGDSQWGNAGTHENGIDRLFDAVHSEYRGCKRNMLAWMGDTIDAITIDDKRFGFAETKISQLRDQRDHAIKRLKEVAGNIIIVLKGNHEQRLFNTYGDIGDEIASTLKCRYGGYCCVPVFRNSGRVQFRAYLHHGFGKLTSNAKDWVQGQANIKAALKNKLQHLFAGATLMAMGHTHQLLAVEPDPSLQMILDDRQGVKSIYSNRDTALYIDHSASVIPEQYRWYVNTGSFLRLYTEGIDGYAERAGMRPTEMGYAVATIRNNRLVKVYKETV